MDGYGFALLVLVVFVTGISKSGFAGALGVISVPILLFKFPPATAIALMLPVLIIADIFSVKSYWKLWDPALLKRILPSALVGVVVGHFFLGSFDTSVLATLVALLAIAFSIRQRFFAHASITFFATSMGGRVLSVLSGISSTLVHAGGPPLMMHLGALKLKPSEYIATSTVFFAVLNLSKLGGFVSLGLLDWQMVLMAMLCIPFAIAGNVVGITIQKQFDTKLFLSTMNLVLFGIGIALLIKTYL